MNLEVQTAYHSLDQNSTNAGGGRSESGFLFLKQNLLMNCKRDMREEIISLLHILIVMIIDFFGIMDNLHCVIFITLLSMNPFLVADILF